MPRKILMIQGHPDRRGGHLCHGLADAYAEGAAAADHEVKRVEIAALEFPVLRTREDWTSGEAVPDIKDAQEVIRWADHLVIVYPLWLGTMPALLKAFLEQVARPGFAIGTERQGMTWTKGLVGRSARVVVTMGMPAFVYRFWFGAHSLKSLERNILRFVGIKPVRESLFGGVENVPEARRSGWLRQMRDLGSRAV